MSADDDATKGRPPALSPNDARYFERFPRSPGGAPTAKAARAYSVALDLRKFEIELYWKRAAYFWVFTGAALAAHLAAMTGKDVTSRPEALLLTACIGLVFATAWYYVNRASKYWQLNWEFHVDMLEDDECGPLYKTVLESDARLADLGGAYPFSVSKINQWLSLFVALVFAALALHTANAHYAWSSEMQAFPTGCAVLTLGALAVLTFQGRVASFQSSVTMKQRQTGIGKVVPEPAA